MQVDCIRWNHLMGSRTVEPEDNSLLEVPPLAGLARRKSGCTGHTLDGLSANWKLTLAQIPLTEFRSASPRGSADLSELSGLKSPGPEQKSSKIALRHRPS
jgi:hypothetical protein